MTLPQFYNAWFCPFAQRVWIALLHKGIEFDYIEQDPYNKSPEWLAINPRGLVPTIVHQGKSIFESTICIEYIDDAWNDKGSRLLPVDPYQKAHVRMWCDFLSKKCIPPFYSILLKDKTKRKEAAQEILSSIEEFFNAADEKGPFFMGTEFSMADIMLAPYAYRFDVILQHYRGFQVPCIDKFKRYHTWWKAVQELEAYRKTLPLSEKLVENYKRYADDTTMSEVAVAIREGKALP